MQQSSPDERDTPTHAHAHPWGCAIISFVCGALFLLIALAILAYVIPNFDTSGQMPPRPVVPKVQLEAQRDSELSDRIAAKTRATEQLVDRMYARQQKDPDCTMDFLVLSGGGEHGAFGSGVLLGWSTIKTGPNALPTFDGVSGVSAGSYIAPYAYLGTQADLETVNNFFRNPQPDWAVRRGMFFFQPNNASLVNVDGLARDLDAQMTLEFAKRIDQATTPGRLLIIQATNIDQSITHLFDFAGAAKQAAATGNSEHLSQILLASSAVPAAFPPREIEGSLFVDGCVGGNFYAGGRASAKEDTFGGIWKRKYPNAPIPTTRYWVIINGTLRATSETVQPDWAEIAEQAVEMSMGAAEIVAIRQLYALAEITKLRGDGDVEVRWIALPEDFKVPDGGGEFFDQAAMRGMSEEGQRLGADPTSWMTTSP